MKISLTKFNDGGDRTIGEPTSLLIIWFFDLLDQFSR